MKLPLLKILGRALAISALLCGPLQLAQAAKPAANADADAVLEQWAEASGGAKRLKAIRQSDYRLRTTFGPGLSLESQGTALSSGGYRLVMQTPIGEMISADDGRIGWIHHESLGGRVLEPAKAERERRTTGPAEILRVRDDYPERRRLPDAEIEGKKVSVLELTDARGWKERWFFSATTGLRVRREQLDSEKGSVTDYSDFRKVNGVVEPFRVLQRYKSNNTALIEVQSAAHSSKVTAPSWSVPEGLEEESARIDEVFRKFHQSLGTKEALAKIKSRVTKSRLEVASNGMSLIMHMSVREPDRVLIEQDVPGMGKVLQGFDGKTGWTWSDMQGDRELQGAELVQLASTAKISPRLADDETPLRRVVSESVGPDGHRILAVDLATLAGSTGVCHFDLETGLIVKVETLLRTGPGSSLKALLELSDYREVDGVKIAHMQSLTNPALRIVTTVLEVEHNRDLPDEIFLPRKKGEIPTTGTAPTAKPSTADPTADPPTAPDAKPPTAAPVEPAPTK